MRRLLGIALMAIVLLLASNAEAQTIALGERTPRIKKAKWLNGNAPQKSDFTYIEFIHSASQPCRASAERIHKIVNKFGNISFVLVSHQKASEIDEWITAHIDAQSGVIIEDNRLRTSFGVNYAPYAVIINHKRRALWFGNPQLLDRKTIENLTQK